MKSSIANLIWLQSLSNDYKYFKKYLKDPSKIQNRILKKYLQENKNTFYGKKYSFESINSISLPSISHFISFICVSFGFTTQRKH